MAIAAFSTLPEETEVLMQRIIGCALAVHRQLGPGFLENIYCRALCIELECAGIRYERERSLSLQYRGRPVGAGRVDLIVGGAVIVEIKAVTNLDPVFQAQLLSYLKAVCALVS